MKKLTLNIEALAVESFETHHETSLRGTIAAREVTPQDGCNGGTEYQNQSCGYCTVNLSGCRSCEGTCYETCAATCPVSCVYSGCPAFCGGGGGNLSEAHTCAGCDDGGMPHYTAVSPCNNTA